MQKKKFKAKDYTKYFKNMFSFILYNQISSSHNFIVCL